VKLCSAEALVLLGQMKQPSGLTAADHGKLRAALEAVLATAEVHTHTHRHFIYTHICFHTDFFSPGQKLRPRGLELQQGELGDLVEQEMAATSIAVETAAARIEVCVCVFSLSNTNNFKVFIFWSNRKCSTTLESLTAV